MAFRVGIFYILTWFFLMLLGGIQQETGLLPAEIGLAQWGPGIAGLLMLVIFRKDGHKITFFSKETPLQRYFLAALIPAGLSMVTLFVSTWIPRAVSSIPTVYDSLWLVILWMPLGALGEEIGWRGYLHKKLDTRMRGLFSSLLTGILWFPIHIHFFDEGPLFVFFLLLLILSYSVVLYALVQDTGFNILLAGLFHLTVNMSNLLYLDLLYETPFMMVNALLWVIVASFLVITKRDLFLKK